jgi:hypothetical protein
MTLEAKLSLGVVNEACYGVRESQQGLSHPGRRAVPAVDAPEAQGHPRTDAERCGSAATKRPSRNDQMEADGWTKTDST